jgi:hypothetical protein
MWIVGLLAIYGVLVTGSATAASDVDQRCPGTALDRGASVIGSFGELKHVLREASYSGRFIFQATITDAGNVLNPVVIAPDRFKDSEAVRSSIEALKFCPAVRYGRYASSRTNFDLRVE